MKASRRFNAKDLREVRDFCVSRIPDGGLTLTLLADRAEDPTAQEQRRLTGRRIYDHFVIELSRSDAEKLDRALGTNGLARALVRGLGEGVGRSLGDSLLKRPTVDQKDSPCGSPERLADGGQL